MSYVPSPASRAWLHQPPSRRTLTLVVGMVFFALLAFAVSATARAEGPEARRLVAPLQGWWQQASLGEEAPGVEAPTPRMLLITVLPEDRVARGFISAVWAPETRRLQGPWQLTPRGLEFTVRVGQETWTLAETEDGTQEWRRVRESEDRTFAVVNVESDVLTVVGPTSNTAEEGMTAQAPQRTLFLRSTPPPPSRDDPRTPAPRMTATGGP